MLNNWRTVLDFVKTTIPTSSILKHFTFSVQNQNATEAIAQTVVLRSTTTYLISTPPLTMYLDTFWPTHWSEAAMEDAKAANKSLGIPTITSMPLPLRAQRTSGSASNSFTFPILFSLMRSTTTEGGSLWEDSVPQLTPMAESTKRRHLSRKNPQNRAFAKLEAAISTKDLIFIAISRAQAALEWIWSKVLWRRREWATVLGSSEVGGGKEKETEDQSRN